MKNGAEASARCLRLIRRFMELFPDTLNVDLLVRVHRAIVKELDDESKNEYLYSKSNIITVFTTVAKEKDKRMDVEIEEVVKIELCTDDEEDAWDITYWELESVWETFDTEFWFAEGKDMGWRKSSGKKYWRAKNLHEFLQGFTPKTSDYTAKFTIFPSHMEVMVSHHDAPTGETYIIRPATNREREQGHFD